MQLRSNRSTSLFWLPSTPLPDNGSSWDIPLGRALGSTVRENRTMLALKSAVVPIGQMASPWDIGHAAVILASDNAVHVTDHCLPVDGGLSLGVGMSTN